MPSSRLVAVVVAVLGALLLLSGPAAAGGPTSVLIVSPEHGTTASLYTTDEDYALLARVLGEDLALDAEASRAEPDRGAPGINVTWLIHDVQIWRVDRVVMDADGEAWIYTQASLGGDLDHTSGVWHRSAHPDELLDLLARLGVLGSDGAKPLTDSGAATRDDATPATAQSSTATGRTSSWTLPALAGGIVVGVLGDRLLRRRREERGDGGRWELIDAPPR